MMKLSYNNTFKYWLVILLAASFMVSCSKDANDNIEPSQAYYVNPPYPTDADTLRILAIGNSFTQDATQYLEAMTDAASIDNDRLCLYQAFAESASFKTWNDIFHNQKEVTLNRKCGNIDMKAVGPMSELLNQNWDVIVIQQLSNKSYVWTSFGDMKPLMDYIMNTCPNRRVCFAYQLTWVHTTSEMPYVLDGNIECCKKMIATYGVDVIIPTGTAIQRARGTILNDNMYLTRDNWHLNTGIARYIASCTWFEKLICPVFGGTVLGNTAKPNRPDSSATDYTDEEIRIAQECAIKAIQYPYNY